MIWINFSARNANASPGDTVTPEIGISTQR